jgi:phosphoesterase RecJ-like protein
MTMTTTNWTEAWAAVQAASSILIVTHMYPDGDAIGTLLGLTNALRAQGKQVDAAVDGGVPDFLAFLPGQQTVLPHLKSGAWDVMISVDASDEARTGHCGAYGRANSQRVINLDHHATNTLFGDIHLVDAGASSAAQVACDWLAAVGVTPDYDAALPLLTGLTTDTLGFRTSNVTPHTLGIAQTLIATGASLAEVAARTLDSRPYQTLMLWRSALQTVSLEDGVIYATVTQEDLKRAGGKDNADLGLSNFLVQTDEAAVSAVFRETDEGRVELSFRAKLGYDVSQVAFSLGGGGHKQASGATVDGPLAAVVIRVLPLLKVVVEQGKKAYH